MERASHSASSSLQVLWYLLTVPGHAAPMNHLSRPMGFSTGGTTKAVDRLWEAGLLERRASRSDRRVTYAALTPVGLSAAADASSALAEALRRRVGRPESVRIVSPPSRRTSRCSTRHRDRVPPAPGRTAPASEQLPGRASLSGASTPRHTVDPFAQQVGVADVARVLRDHVDVDQAQ
ncbi:MarR family transcriptional regulator [Streptomyces sp. NPDC097727]|uniref:MarR family transcriptional regulator n=1 Tax=Streptomyces sp. NPDC097727 TaxID=3366092 RepID=UPI0038080B93